MRHRYGLSSASMALTSNGEIMINAATVFAGSPHEVLRRAIESGQPVFIGFQVDPTGTQQVLHHLDEAVADISVRMIFEFAARKP